LRPTSAESEQIASVLQELSGKAIANAFATVIIHPNQWGGTAILFNVLAKQFLIWAGHVVTAYPAARGS
jgi:hypothetical protein